MHSRKNTVQRKAPFLNLPCTKGTCDSVRCLTDTSSRVDFMKNPTPKESIMTFPMTACAHDEMSIFSYYFQRKFGSCALAVMGK